MYLSAKTVSSVNLWLPVVIGLLCAALGFFASHWIGQKDKQDEELQKELKATRDILGIVRIQIAHLQTLIEGLPCMKAGQNGTGRGSAPSRVCPDDFSA